ncbi:MAG: hypothetical protein ACRDV3_10570 [Acidothermaceae bacterium]
MRVLLGLLWLVAGCLQLQPFMFTKGLALDVIAPSAARQPVMVTGPVGLFVRVVAAHPAAFNTAFATAELAVGLGLVVLRRRRGARFISAAGISLALGIWWLGEGFGGVLSGTSAASMGAPGAALLYALIGLAAWPARNQRALPARWTRLAWFVVWTGTAALSALPLQTSPDALAGQVEMGSSMSPAVLGRPELALAERMSRMSAGVALAIAATLVAVQLFIAVGGLGSGRLRTTATRCALLFAAITWVLCQGFGGVTTGEATDVATGPLLALFTLTLVSAQRRRSARSARVTRSARPTQDVRPQVISSSFSRTA